MSGNDLTVLSQELIEVARKLQRLSSLASFALSGGTNLAFRYNHRYSDDLDFFTDRIVGVDGLVNIKDQLDSEFGKDRLTSEIINQELGDQYCFLRSFLNVESGLTIKMEMVQNMMILYPIDNHAGLRMVAVKDIGLFKLRAACSRRAKKDIYDLDLITDQHNLSSLLTDLSEKERRFSEERHRCLFDLDMEASPTENIDLLTAFDTFDYEHRNRSTNHTTDRIRIPAEGKSWLRARSSWLAKVREAKRRN